MQNKQKHGRLCCFQHFGGALFLGAVDCFTEVNEKVFVKIKEGDKQRLQGYEGVVIARKNGSVRETFTVRRISNGVGVERTFPVHSPLIDHVDVVRRGKPRRAKLYYVRELTGKAAKIKSADNR